MATAVNRSVFPLPLTVEEIDRDWLTAALRVKAPGTTVRDFAIAEVIHTTSTNVRLKLDLDDAGKRAGIPEVVFVKGGFQAHSRDLGWMHKIEALGYRDLLAGGELNSPRCYFADWDEERQQGVVIMEDLTLRGGAFGHLRQTRNHDEVANGLTLLAAYHARTWGCSPYPPGHEYGWVLQGTPFETSPYKDFLEPAAHAEYVKLPRAAAASAYFQDLDWIVEARRRIELLAKRVPHCIIHGDAHPGNVFFEPGGKPAFFDIVPRRAPAMFEASYHITLSMDPIDRRRWEKELVRHYLDELRGHGVEPPSSEDAMFQFGVYVAESFILGFYNIPDVVPEDTIVAVVARNNAAMIDHDSIGLIASIA